MQERSFVSITPSRHVRDYVEAYWFCTPGQPSAFLNCPLPRPLLALRLQGNIVIDGQHTIDELTLAGIRTSRALMRCIDGYYALLMPLTIAGALRLFPGLGEAANTRFDFGGVVGDRLSRVLYGSAVTAWEPRRIAAVLDNWITERLQTVTEPREIRRFLAAYARLSRGEDLAAAASYVDVSSRQLERWFDTHLGIGPKRLTRLERLHRSLQAIRAGGDPLQGYSDQSHQIRDFQTYLQLTPGQYKRESARLLAADGKIGRQLVREAITLTAVAPDIRSAQM